jgi:hypothetical protein
MRALGASRTSLVPGGVLAGPWVRDGLWRKARAVPSLDLRFADNKSLVDAVTGASLVTFTRASSGTYVGSDGVIQTAATDVPRFDHNPTTGESLGLLVEEQRTNLLLRSEEFDNASWAKLDSTVTADAIDSPGGTLAGDFVVENATTARHSVNQTYTKAASAIQYTLTVYAKSNSSRNLVILANGASFNDRVEAGFNTTTGTVAPVNILGNFSSTSSSIINAGNGWYRCSITFTSDATTSLVTRLLLINQNPITNPSSTSYTGDGTSGIYLWGAQLEAGAFPTSYIPTTTAAVTRIADVASSTGSAFSGWYRQDEGTMFAEFYASAYNTASLAISDGTNSNRIMIDRGSTGTRYTIANAGALQTTGFQIPYTLNSLAKVSLGFALDNCNLAVNGLAQADDTSVNIPSAVDRLLLGVNASAGGYGNAPIKRLCFWPTRLADSTLQQLTQ